MGLLQAQVTPLRATLSPKTWGSTLKEATLPRQADAYNMTAELMLPYESVKRLEFARNTKNSGLVLPLELAGSSPTLVPSPRGSDWFAPVTMS